MGIDCVGMESAALYEYAAARHRDVICLAHITNTTAADGDDFENGHHNSALDALSVIRACILCLSAARLSRISLRASRRTTRSLTGEWRLVGGPRCDTRCGVRWVVERMLSWITRHRRTVRDYGRLPAHHETCVCWSMIIVMTRSLGRWRATAQPQVA